MSEASEKLKKVFEGKVVNKKLTRLPALQEFPRYVVEYLVDNYCKEETFDDDIKRVFQAVRKQFVQPAEAETIKHNVKQRGSFQVIANVEVRLQETEDKYWASIGALKERHIHVPDQIVKAYPMLLHGGMWGMAELGYDASEIHGGKIRPFKIATFTPFQVGRIRLDEYVEKRRFFATDEWLDVLINTIGLNPTFYSRREKLLMVARLIPLVETNNNCIELGPRETGKTYLMRNISYYAHVLSGGKVTVPQLFINNASGVVGLVGNRDSIVFDEIAKTQLTEPEAAVAIMTGYMQDGRFSRGKQEVPAQGSLVFGGNLDVQGKLPHQKYYQLFEVLPSVMNEDVAFLDRLHMYLPGWEIPKITPDSYSMDYGFVTDYFCEIMHKLRQADVLSSVAARISLVDFAHTDKGITGRDERAFLKNLSGLAKLVYPDGRISDEELAEICLLACEGRQRVRDQLHILQPGEYEKVEIGFRLNGSEYVPELRERGRIQKIELSTEPLVGEVTGLAVAGSRGVLQRFEIIVNKGSGRLIPLGSIQRVMKESVQAAYEYIRSHSEDLGITVDFRREYDISVLATQMGMPKEGPSAGITVLVGLVSALTGRPVRPLVALTGEITLKGKILEVGGIVEKLRAAVDAGINEVFIPLGNEKDLDVVPGEIKRKIKINLVSRIEEVLSKIFVGEA